MSKLKKLIIIICLTAVIAVFYSCNSITSVVNGKYYLNGDEDNTYISIINDNTLKFVGFNVEHLAEGIEDATGFEDDDLTGFREEYDLLKIFNDEIEFEFDKNNSILYLHITGWVGYSMEYENNNMISFMGNEYIR